MSDVILKDEYDRTEADARLIAAAPDLLEALRDVLDYATAGPNGTGLTENWNVVKAARAAIAKAEGGN